ncbi:MAG: DUF3662 domain-containing protein [Armatimonadetes bacterium]|nr:DUF3662 domain-containing protein [Armatimonadota bacterium]MDE2205313.1 DUF3662 domain-containing protein [Armatimonadota bacterium]
MKLLTLLNRLDRKLERIYEHGFGAPRDIRAADVLKELKRAMEADLAEDARGNRLAPNEYEVTIYPRGEEEREKLLTVITAESLAEVLEQTCRERGYIFAGDLRLSVTASEAPPSQGAASLSVKARFKRSEPAIAPEPPQNQPVGRFSDLDDDMTVAAHAGAEVVVEEPGLPPATIGLRSGSLTIGRSQTGNELVLNSSQVSRRHARIDRELDGTFTVHDLKSRNGTIVNGRPIEARALGDGDTITIGDVVLRFRLTGRRESQLTAPAGAPPLELEWRDEAGALNRRVCGSSTRFGAGITCDVVLPAATRQQLAEITIADGCYWVTNLAGEPGAVSLNGEPLAANARRRLAAGDEIAMAGRSFTVQFAR